ncbi:hypothetical protein HS088_TW13G00327 [Tripterygium wilfordii]|uniref:Uncharacterized protein n=1 Tax=Tripterygium wilfordii TaxID=458696 RepID=A0A7J7CU72_TRIWF|nr:uncharacterized protein LOC120012187 [Tripterygium wilfordii]KAF5737446.1 hypothetical protein HS088_TW13G00327 [Tripterygium wilfordii]
MGNCLVVEDQVIQVMKPDGKILEYRAPINVNQVTSEYSGHAISDTLQVIHQHLLPETKLIGGHLYYLVPLPSSPPEIRKKKKVRFSNPEKEDGQGSSVVRIKIIISKQELQEMLQKEGVSVDNMLSHLQVQEKVSEVDRSSEDDNSNRWKPALESIAEVN